MKIKESQLHQIWKHGLLTSTEFLASNGKIIKILNFGEHNTHSGPDFFNAQILFDNIIWIGNLEIHVKSSDFKKHKHHNDPNYSNLILHAVYEIDGTIENEQFGHLATVELKKYIQPETFNKIINYKKNVEDIVCQKQLWKVDDSLINNWLGKLVKERLDGKIALIESELKIKQNNWNEVFWIFLTKYFGAPVNSLPFEMLARSINFSIILKNNHTIFQLEALLLGQAGLLNKIADNIYQKRLHNEYLFLKQKHNLTPLSSSIFKFLRLRPISFPTYRIALLSAVLHNKNHFFEALLDAENKEQLYSLLNAQVSSFWISQNSSHQRNYKNKFNLGREGMNKIIINVVIPFMIVWGKTNNNRHYTEKAELIFNQLNAENNHITHLFKNAGLSILNAKQSQALITLKKNYCDLKRCKECAIGKILTLNSNC